VIERVEARGASRLHGSTLALRGVSTHFDPGTISLIEGPNGSGKSTLMGLLSTASRPTSGRILWEPYGDSAERARPHVGWLGHEALVYPDLSGRENLAWVAQLHGLPPSVVDEVAARIGLGSFALRPVRTMSRGQRQRIAIARALLHRPSLLLLDEPTTGLDRDGVALLLRLVREERDRGAIVVLIAHDPGLGRELGARVLQMNHGRLAEAAEVAAG
jgi:heme exporter protein A